MKQARLLVASGAEFSRRRTWRYDLWRVWNWGDLIATFICLNPSTADENSNDPTVERLERRARMWGYGGVHVLNIFSYRSTDPEALLALSDPIYAIGPLNDEHILARSREAGIVICAWGGHKSAQVRGPQVEMMLRSAGVKLHALRLNADGSPQHPLYLPYSAKPFEWKARAFSESAIADAGSNVLVPE